MLIFPLESKGKHVVEFYFQVFHPFLKRVLELNPIVIDNSISNLHSSKVLIRESGFID